MRGATHHLSPPSQRPRNFNPRAPCGARRSILNGCGVWTHFNPRAPCGARQNVSPNQSIIAVFQPTRPLRGATILILPPALLVFYFNPRAPCGARHVNRFAWYTSRKISTHAPLAGRDGKIIDKRFNDNRISTHAPLAGRDSKSVQITMHIFAITDKFQMFLRKMPTVRAFCFFFVREKRANFSANRPDNFCALVLRTIRSSVPRADTSACSRSVRFYSRTSCPSSKIEGCPFLGQ